MNELLKSPVKGGTVIFRRFRRRPNSDEMMDAHDYGYEAWPIRIWQK